MTKLIFHHPLVNRHYEGNRSKNQVVRSDLHQAKHLQEDELAEMRRIYELRLQQQLERDARIAQEIQNEELRAQSSVSHPHQQHSFQDRDLLLAQRLQEKEKQRQIRRRLAKEKREVEKISHGAPVPTAYEDNRLQAGIHNVPDVNGDYDLSEFCMKPPPGLTDLELQAFQAEQDAELARFLQEQEAKKDSRKEKLTIIESQDHEIARILQEQERAKAKRLKEKARLKKSNGLSRKTSSDGMNEYLTNHSDADPVGEPAGADQPPEAALDSTNEETTIKSLNNQQANFHNVAMDLDPTYNKPQSTDPAGLHFAALCRVSPSISPSPSDTIQQSNEETFDEDYNSYMPVQGHRRNSPEKSKKKKSKDGCKTQWSAFSLQIEYYVTFRTSA